eukprot:1656973-Amphidinium_carterae.1
MSSTKFDRPVIQNGGMVVLGDLGVLGGLGLHNAKPPFIHAANASALATNKYPPSIPIAPRRRCQHPYSACCCAEFQKAVKATHHTSGRNKEQKK